jgi:hypothetical protein
MDENRIFLLDYRLAFMLNRHVIKNERVVELGAAKEYRLYVFYPNLLVNFFSQ